MTLCHFFLLKVWLHIILFPSLQYSIVSLLPFLCISFFFLSLSITLFLVCPTLSLLLAFSVCLICPFNSSLYPIIFFFCAHFSTSPGLLFLSFLSSIYSQPLPLPSQCSSPEPCLIACRHLCKSPSCARGFLWTRPVGSLSLCVLEAVLAHLEKQSNLFTQRDCLPRGAARGTSARTSCPAVSSRAPGLTSREAGKERGGGGGAEEEGAWGEGKRL